MRGVLPEDCGVGLLRAGAFYIVVYMKTVLIQLDDELVAELEKAAPASERERSEFIRQAIRNELHRSEFDRIDEAYRRQPDSADEADDWSDPLEWNPEPATK